MGLQKHGDKVVAWSDITASQRDYVIEHGAMQFLHLWRRYRDKCNDPFLWGEEVTSISNRFQLCRLNIC
jgi:hypothetical protein